MTSFRRPPRLALGSVGGKRGALVVGALLLIGACSTSGESRTSEPAGEGPDRTDVRSTTGVAVTMTTERVSTTERMATTSSTSSTTSTTAATTTTLPALPVHDPACVVQIKAGDNLTQIVETVANDAVTVESVQAENSIADPQTIFVDDYLDVCVGNGLDDITGVQRTPAGAAAQPTAPAVAALVAGVQAQQQKLNELFAGYGLPPLAIDGDSGRLTEQQLCAARMALNLPVSRADMEPGGPEEQALMAATSLSIPAGAPVSASRWALIDRTCQIMFVGEGSNRIVFVFQTSTGEAGYETRDQNGSRAFRYNPAPGNNGWHNSYDYPAAGDNPLNGNMYLPVYFDGGQAIHGAFNVPPAPASKGCARLRVESQDAFVNWLGLRDVSEPIWGDEGRIDLSVTVQGEY